MKFRQFMFSFLMSLTLSIIMSGWVTAINLGLGGNFIEKWLHAFVLAWPAAFVISFTLSGRVKSVSEKLCDRWEKNEATK